jgi:transposase-like protein
MCARSTFRAIAQAAAGKQSPLVDALEEYESEITAWQDKRDSLIAEYFSCPVCHSNTGFSKVTGQFRGGRGRRFTTVGGFVGYKCYHCTVFFENPTLFTARKDELKIALEKHEERKPQKPQISDE